MSGKYGEDNCPSHPFSPSRPCENNRTEDDEQQKNSTKGSNDGDSITNTTKRIQSESDSEVKTISDIINQNFFKASSSFLMCLLWCNDPDFPSSISKCILNGQNKY